MEHRPEQSPNCCFWSLFSRTHVKGCSNIKEKTLNTVGIKLIPLCLLQSLCVPSLKVGAISDSHRDNELHSPFQISRTKEVGSLVRASSSSWEWTEVRWDHQLFSSPLVECSTLIQLPLGGGSRDTSQGFTVAVLGPTVEARGLLNCPLECSTQLSSLFCPEWALHLYRIHFR